MAEYHRQPTYGTPLLDSRLSEAAHGFVGARTYLRGGYVEPDAMVSALFSDWRTHATSAASASRCSLPYFFPVR